MPKFWTFHELKQFVKEHFPYKAAKLFGDIYNGYGLLKTKMLKKFPHKYFVISVDVVDHCNLGCRSCLNFSPVSEETYLDPSVFERDIARLSELTDRLKKIKIYGGEPLLHPQIIKFIEIARKYFKDSPIEILTNGILLRKQPEEFWQACQKNSIMIFISNYPININLKEIEQITKKYNVTLNYYFDKANEMLKRPLDLSGKHDYKKNFKRCGFPNGECVILYDGKLYTCAIPGHIRIFNHYFKQNFEITENDYINIYKVKDVNEIRNFLCKPIPFCRYCDLENIQYHLKWENSTKQIEEWVNLPSSN